MVKLGFVLSGLLIALAIGFAVVLVFLPLAPFEHAIATALDGTPAPRGDAQYRVVCAGFECADVLSRLPPVSQVSCTQPLAGRGSRASFGACCSASFAELGSTEIHVFREDSRYEILLTEPRMRRVIRALADAGR